MTSSSSIGILPALDADLPACFSLTSRSFAHDAPFVDAYFPEHDTSVGRSQASARLLAWKQSEPESTFLKAVLSPAGAVEQIIGFAVWTLMKSPPSDDLAELEDVKSIWKDESDREYMTRLWRSYVVPRSNVVKEAQEKGVYVLELLAVDPRFHRRGAGTALVGWGTAAADNAGLEAIIEGTPVGRRTYEKCGFRAEIEQMEFEVGEEFQTRKKPQLVFMRRKKRAHEA